MSQGKYSPCCPHCNDGTEFEFNSYGQPVAPMKAGVPYDVATMFGNFDNDGFDAYGYSCFYKDGKWAGLGCGVDRLGYTEDNYLVMDEDEFCGIADSVRR